MELYDMMKNIRGINIEKELLKSILKVKLHLRGLTKERMCKVYSSYLLKELLQNHISARLINSKDLGDYYEHQFLLISYSSELYFLVDLTYSQFKIKDNNWEQLYESGYQLVDDEKFNNYLNIITNYEITDRVFLEELFYMNRRIKR